MSSCHGFPLCAYQTISERDFIQFTAIQQLLKEAKEEERKKYESEKKTELDDSFFTSNMHFNKEDFDDATPVKEKTKKGIWKKVALVLSLISITIGIIVLVYMLIK